MNAEKIIRTLYQLIANSHGAEITINKIEKIEQRQDEEKQPA